ncbi:AAA family ATPase [Streptomyces sp. N2-109]|uniref:AAA family ATPase n=1 Tax=Streptomyces gossypii TaxID=2883101 RepID=A0ABT2JXH6_9ACTN|nr:helix-turn-helix transcriptional regulator [Streptomyces gossypii]MCT2592602.1 AAA family ATPase [Streptomyces gossypii]
MPVSRESLPATALDSAGAAPMSVGGVMLGGVENNIAVSPVFVGRSEEFAALTEMLVRADAGEPQLLLVGGEAGVGKTRLLEEFLGHARKQGAVTALGGCLELGADGLPFAPFATALRSLHRTLGGAEIMAAAGGREAELARLLPDLAPLPAAAASAHREVYGGEDGRARLFELTAQLLERLAGGRTLVLAIEDLHWADRSTRELLGYLYRSVQSCRLILVATYRADDIHRRHPLRPFLAEHDRLRTVRRIELPRLSLTEVRAQIAGIQGVAEPESELVETIFDRTDGNPFFVEELTENCATCGISESLRDLLLVRVEALPEPAQRVVRIAAQGGSKVEHTLLATVCELPQDELLEALRAAVGASVLLPADDVGLDGGYRFRHALLREAVSDDLLPGEGARISRRYAQALEADPGLVRAEVRATRLAHHWYRGRDAAKALPAVLAASVEARAQHAYAEQHQLLERAIELWEDVPAAVRAKLRPIDDAEVYPACAAEPEAESLRFMDLLAETVVAARSGGEIERALAVAKRALAMLDENHDALRAAWFWVQRSLVMEALGRSDGWDEIARAQQLVRGLPPSAVHAAVLTAAAGWGMLHAPGADALSTAVRAVELARVVGAEVTEASARITLGGLMAHSGDVEAGLAEIRTARERAVELGAYALVCRAGINLAAELDLVGRSSEAVEEAAQGARAAEEHGRRDQQAFALGNQAAALQSMGRWDEAAELVEKARRLAVWPTTRGWQELLSCQLAMNRGDFAALEVAHARVREQLPRPRQPHCELPARRFALVLAAHRGAYTQARAELEGALDQEIPVGMHVYVWPLLHSAASSESGFLGLPGAEAGRAEALALIRRVARTLPHPAVVWKAHSLLVGAELSRAQGASDETKWAEAVAAFEPLERPYELAQARHRWAEALLSGVGSGVAEGTRAKATELLTLSHAAAATLGARPLMEEAEQLAARARIDLRAAAAGEVKRRSSARQAAREEAEPAASFGLTARERGVLELVAAGRSNRQIAEQLFISPKTASVHVSNIMTKLGVAGRGEAAAMAHRLRLVTGAGSPVTG